VRLFHQSQDNTFWKEDHRTTEFSFASLKVYFHISKREDT
jgi:hypothetical protein